MELFPRRSPFVTKLAGFIFAFVLVMALIGAVRTGCEVIRFVAHHVFIK